MTSPITTNVEAENAIDHLTGLIEKLCGLMEQESALVRAGRVRTASALEPAKAQLAGQLFTAGEQLKANAKFLLHAVPARCVALARVQDAFRAVLQKNMIVLATAHAVSEGIMRRLSGDLARKRSPQVYGASGKTTPPSAKHGQPLAISRVL
jgi:hypothetical protein